MTSPESPGSNDANDPYNPLSILARAYQDRLEDNVDYLRKDWGLVKAPYVSSDGAQLLLYGLKNDSDTRYQAIDVQPNDPTAQTTHYQLAPKPDGLVVSKIVNHDRVPVDKTELSVLAFRVLNSLPE